MEAIFGMDVYLSSEYENPALARGIRSEVLNKPDFVKR